MYRSVPVYVQVYIWIRSVEDHKWSAEGSEWWTRQDGLDRKFETLCESVQYQTEFLRPTRLSKIVLFTFSWEDRFRHSTVRQFGVDHRFKTTFTDDVFETYTENVVELYLNLKKNTDKISWIVLLVVGVDIVKVFGGELYREWIIDADFPGHWNMNDLFSIVWISSDIYKHDITQ